MSRLILCYIAICDPSLTIVQQCSYCWAINWFLNEFLFLLSRNTLRLPQATTELYSIYILITQNVCYLWFFNFSLKQSLHLQFMRTKLGDSLYRLLDLRFMGAKHLRPWLLQSVFTRLTNRGHEVLVIIPFILANFLTAKRTGICYSIVMLLPYFSD